MKLLVSVELENSDQAVRKHQAGEEGRRVNEQRSSGGQGNIQSHQLILEHMGLRILHPEDLDRVMEIMEIQCRIVISNMDPLKERVTCTHLSNHPILS